MNCSRVHSAAARIHALLRDDAAAPHAPADPSPRVHRPVVLVVPLHPPKFQLACSLALSWAAHAHAASLRLVFVFSSLQDQHAFREAYGCLLSRLPASAIIVAPPTGSVEMCTSGTSLQDRALCRLPPGSASGLPYQSLVSYKRLAAVKAVFEAADPPSHVIALDADVLLQPGAVDPVQAVQRWEDQRQVMLSHAERVYHRPAKLGYVDFLNASFTSTAAVGLSVPERPHPHWCALSWFTDAPVFSRHDFFDFYSKLRFPNVTTQEAVEQNLFVFDHLSYMCYKAHFQNWTLVPLPGKKLSGESLTSTVQDRLRSGHSFIWSRDVSSHRLVQFHVDRHQKESNVRPLCHNSTCSSSNCGFKANHDGGTLSEPSTVSR